MSSGMAASPRLRGPGTPAAADAFSMDAVVARDEEVLVASGACSPCGVLVARKDMDGLSAPQHGTMLVPPPWGLGRPWAAPSMPRAGGTFTSAGAKLRGSISRYSVQSRRSFPADQQSGCSSSAGGSGKPRAIVASGDKALAGPRHPNTGWLGGERLPWGLEPGTSPSFSFLVSSLRCWSSSDLGDEG